MYLPHQAVHSGNGGTKEVLEAPWKYQQKVQHIKHPGRRMLAGRSPGGSEIYLDLE